MIFTRVAVVLAIVFAPLLCRQAWAAPDYIHASPREFTAKYGEDLARLAFSDELTDLRAAKVQEGLTFVSEKRCPSRPKFALVDIEPFQLDATAVTWIERYDVACRSTLRRTLLMVKKGDSVQAVPMAPGETLTDPLLQVDAGKLARETALTLGPADCARATVIETVVSRKPAQSGSPWQERWSVRTCGEVINLDVSFNPSAANGTKIAVANNAGGNAVTAKSRGEDGGPPNGGQKPVASEQGATATARGEDWADCQWTKRLSKKPDKRVAACERAIASGALNAADLATAHRWLGDALRVKLLQQGEDFDVFDKFELSDRVFDIYSKAIELNPKDPETYVRRATIHDDGETAKAIADYSKAIELGDTESYISRSNLYKKSGEIDLAIADLGSAIKIKPYGHYFRDRALLRLAIGDYENVIADVDAGLGLKPSRSDAALSYLIRGVAQQRLGNPKQALADYARSESSGRDTIFLRYHRGGAYMDIGEYGKAVGEFTGVIEQARTTKGILKDPFAGKTIKYSDMVVPGRTARAYAQAQAGNMDKALADVGQALQLDTDNAEALEIRALIYEAMGRNDMAVADFRKALAIEPNRAASSEGLKRLEASP